MQRFYLMYDEHEPFKRFSLRHRIYSSPDVFIVREQQIVEVYSSAYSPALRVVPC